MVTAGLDGSCDCGLSRRVNGMVCGSKQGLEVGVHGGDGGSIVSLYKFHCRGHVQKYASGRRAGSRGDRQDGGGKEDGFQCQLVYNYVMRLGKSKSI